MIISCSSKKNRLTGLCVPCVPRSANLRRRDGVRESDWARLDRGLLAESKLAVTWDARPGRSRLKMPCPHELLPSSWISTVASTKQIAYPAQCLSVREERGCLLAPCAGTGPRRRGNWGMQAGAPLRPQDLTTAGSRLSRKLSSISCFTLLRKRHSVL